METILYQNKILYIFDSLSIQNIQASLVIQCEIMKYSLQQFEFGLGRMCRNLN